MSFFKNVFRGKLNIKPKVFFQELINAYSLVVNKRMILDITVGKIKEIIPEHSICFFEKKDMTYEYDNGQIISINTQSRLINWLYQNQTYLELKGGISEYVKMDMKNLDVLNPTIIFPMMLHNYIPCFALFSGKPLSNEVKDFIMTVFQLTALAYESVERIDREIKQLDNNYQQKKMIMVGRMASSLAHEIRNPLTSIRSSVQLIQNVLEETEMKSLAGNVMSEVDRINKITQDLLNFAKPRQVNLAPINLEDIIKNTLLIYESKCIENNIKTTLNLKQNAEWIINADPDSFKQVLINFMNNSLEAMELSTEKELIITLERVNETDGLLTWTDTGCGMQTETLEHITEPFYTTKSGGTGLGMAVVKQILDQHNFEFSILSKPGKGTAVSISFQFSNALKKW